MSLKGNRYTVEQEIAYFCNDVVDRGVVLGFGSSGSGVALDQTEALATVPGANVSGVKPLGMLMNDMVSVDQTKFHLNYYKDVMPVGSKCTLLKKGWVVTNKVLAGVTPVAGDKAYLGASGNVTTSTWAGNVLQTGVGAYPLERVGTFLSSKDEAGYAKVEINLP